MTRKLKLLASKIPRGLLVRWARGTAPFWRLGKAPVASEPEPVHILIYHAWGLGGTIRVCFNLAGYLAQGREVEFISIIRTVDEPFFEFPPGVKATALADKRPGARVGLLERVLGRVPSVLVHRSERYVEDFSLWTDIALVRRVRRMSGVLMTTRPGLNLIAGLLRPPHLTLVGQEHMNLEHHKPKLRKSMGQLYPRLDAFVLLTEDHRRDYQRLLKKRAPRLEVIPNTARPLDGAKADPETKVVFAAGRFRAQKGYDYLIPAFAKAAADRPDWRLRICGHGKTQEELEQLVAESGMADRIELAPPTDNMGEEMSRASIFVLSSRFEGFPLVLLEAMSKGMAVVAFDCPTGPADIIDDHNNGLLVRPERDIDALAAGIREMISDDDLRRRCAAAAPELASNFTIEAVGPRWEEFFREVAEQRL